MKNIYKYIFAAMLTLGTTTSCSDFLDEAPKGVIDEDKAFSRPDEMVVHLSVQPLALRRLVVRRLLEGWFWYHRHGLSSYGDMVDNDFHIRRV